MNEFGVNVWWTVPEVAIDAASVKTALVENGFDVSDIKEPSRQTEVSRAARALQDRRHRNGRRLSEVVTDNQRVVVYGILGRQRTGEESVSFEQDTTVLLDKGTGTVTAQGECAKQFENSLAGLTGKITDQDIRYFLRRVVRMCFGIPKRPTGGIYFVPAKYVGVVEQASKFLADVKTGARLYFERVVDGEQERLNVWDSVEAEVSTMIDDALARVDKIGKRSSAVAGQKERIEEAHELMELYKTLLGSEAKFQDVEAKIEKAVAVVSEKLTTVGTEHGNMSVVGAALTVLAESGKEMSVSEIAEVAVARGYIVSGSKNVANSVNANLNHALKTGETRIVKVGRGKYQVAA